MARAFITGGSGGIGAALVREFANTHDVTFTYLNGRSAAEKLAGETRTRAVRCDLSEPESIHAAAETIRDCEVLINNAGIAYTGLFTDMSDADMLRVINTDLTGTMLLTRDIARGMVRAHRGCIINISSVWGVYGASCEVAYSAAKAGIIGFTKGLAKELGPSGIRVNCIAPGVIDTEMNAHLSPDDMRELADSTPLMRIGSPEEVAHAARFLCASTFVTAQIIGVDGGFC